jgi:hypothetical protein
LVAPITGGCSRAQKHSQNPDKIRSSLSNSQPTQANNENTHFHELVHVVQWRLLGPDRFLFSHANGLECFGYRQGPLEAVAYDAETAFAGSTSIFNVEKMVAEKLGL